MSQTLNGQPQQPDFCYLFTLYLTKFDCRTNTLPDFVAAVIITLLLPPYPLYRLAIVPVGTNYFTIPSMLMHVTRCIQ